MIETRSLLQVVVLLPLAMGFVLLFLPKKLSTAPGGLTLLISALSFALAVTIFVGGPSVSTWPILRLPENLGGFELDLMLSVTPLGTFMLLFAMGFAFLITLYSLKSVGAGAAHANQYYGAILLTIGGSAGVLLSNHLLALLIFWEIVTVSLYLLITTGGKNSNFAATKSYAMIGASDAAFMLGVFLLWAIAGTFDISNLKVQTSSAMPIIAFLLLMTAAVTKAGALPMHTWVPASGEAAPASVMALLPAAIDKLLGIYLLVLLVRHIFTINAALTVVLAVIGAATAVIAVMIAMVQHNLKKLLSYHAVSQVGYMILGIASGTPIGIAGGVFHMLNNAIYKCCLFLCGGAVEQQAGTPDLDKLGGLGKKMPITFVTCLIAALSISGIPPLNGFVSKWMIYQGVIQMGAQQSGTAARLWPVWLTCAMFASALTLASFVKLIHSMFLSRMPEKLKDAKEVSPLQTFPMMLLAALCVFFGVFYLVPLKMFIYPALGIGVAPALSTWGSGLAAILIVVGIALGLLIWVAGRLSKKVRIVPTWDCGEIQPSEDMAIPGTHFYKTVSQMGGLKQLYKSQEKGYFDSYDQGGRCGLVVTALLQWLHSGVLSIYLTWVALGLLIVLFVVCGIW